MLRYLVYFAEIILCYLLQTSVFSYFRVSGVVPDCILILIVSIAYTKGQNKAILAGFASGLLLDLLFAETLGVCALIYMFVGFLAGYSNRIYDSKNYWFPAVLVFAGELFYSVGYYITGFFLLGKTSLGAYIMNTILPRSLYTLIVAVFLYPLFLLTDKLLLRSEGMIDE